MLQFKILGHVKGSDSVFYKVVVKHPSLGLLTPNGFVLLRYNLLRLIHQKFVVTHDSSIDFLPLHAFEFDKFSASFLETREREIEQYFKDINGREEIAGDAELLTFFLNFPTFSEQLKLGMDGSGDKLYAITVPEDDVQWRWASDDSWVPYSEEDCATITCHFKTYCESSKSSNPSKDFKITIGSAVYLLDFKSMQQTNLASGNQRPIWVHLKSIFDSSVVPFFFSVEADIFGFTKPTVSKRKISNSSYSPPASFGAWSSTGTTTKTTVVPSKPALAKPYAATSTTTTFSLSSSTAPGSTMAVVAKTTTPPPSGGRKTSTTSTGGTSSWGKLSSPSTTTRTTTTTTSTWSTTSTATTSIWASPSTTTTTSTWSTTSTASATTASTWSTTSATASSTRATTSTTTSTWSTTSTASTTASTTSTASATTTTTTTTNTTTTTTTTAEPSRDYSWWESLLGLNQTKEEASPVGSSGLRSPIPSRQKEILKLIELSPTGKEFQEISTAFAETMRFTVVKKIERIANRRLWQKFDLEVQMLQEKYSHLPKKEYVKMLFHGTRTTSPDKIYASEGGFMMQLAQTGMWGPGIYFAAKAQYSDSYHHRDASTSFKQMFLASVLVGEPYVCAPDNKLRIPPEKPAPTSNLGLVSERYDSVQGNSGDSDIYIVYENSKAYPHYLISYV